VNDVDEEEIPPSLHGGRFEYLEDRYRVEDELGLVQFPCVGLSYPPSPPSADDGLCAQGQRDAARRPRGVYVLPLQELRCVRGVLSGYGPGDDQWVCVYRCAFSLSLHPALYFSTVLSLFLVAPICMY
jgi:hypothetical protein